nr:ribonuclease H-like domain-containing protein [Tanacetum cinerariifolium]
MLEICRSRAINVDPWKYKHGALQKIEFIVTILASLGSPLCNDDMVNIALEGLPDKYENVSGITVHQEPFSDLKMVRSMITTKEMRLKSWAQATSFDSTSSSPMVLLANSGVSSHLNDSVFSLSDVFNICNYPFVPVGDSYSKRVTNSGHSVLPTSHRPLHLKNVLITPNIVKILILVRQFVRDDCHTVEFDALGFSVKDFLTRRVLLRCDSTGYLYLVMKPSTIPHVFLTIQYTLHQRLGHLGSEVLWSLLSTNSTSCNKGKPFVLFHAC